MNDISTTRYVIINLDKHFIHFRNNKSLNSIIMGNIMVVEKESFIAFKINIIFIIIILVVIV